MTKLIASRAMDLDTIFAHGTILLASMTLQNSFVIIPFGKGQILLLDSSFPSFIFVVDTSTSFAASYATHLFYLDYRFDDSNLQFQIQRYKISK